MIMGGKQKWTIADEVLKESFRTLGIDVLYFPLFKKNAIERLNDIADSYEPEQDDINSSIELAGEWVKIYVEQIKLGLSKLWVSTYADYRVSWPKTIAQMKHTTMYVRTLVKKKQIRIWQSLPSHFVMTLFL